MHRRFGLLILSFALLLLSACGSNDNDDNTESPDPPAEPQRGDLIEDPPARIASYSPQELLSLASSNLLQQVIADAILSPECSIDVHQLKYQSVDAAGNLTPVSGTLMVPNGSGAPCRGERPILLYAHGTSTDKNYNIANLQN